MRPGGDARPRVLILQHVEAEGPGTIAAGLVDAGCALETVRTDRGEPLPPAVTGYAGLVVMGGPMSAVAPGPAYPTRDAEAALVRDALERGTPALGICLGAQIIALAGGSHLRHGGGPEIGWGPVSLRPDAALDPLLRGIADEMTVLHWHGDTFDLPPGAVHLAATPAYPNQAFRLGRSAWGLQFHVEVDLAAVRRFVEDFGHEAEDPDSIVRDAPAALARSAQARGLVVERFARLVAAGSGGGGVPSPEPASTFP